MHIANFVNSDRGEYSRDNSNDYVESNGLLGYKYHLINARRTVEYIRVPNIGLKKVRRT